jgi:hypothetical protein
MDEVTRGWRRLHNKGFNDLCSSPILFDQIKKNETGGACSTYGGDERFLQSFSGET